MPFSILTSRRRSVDLVKASPSSIRVEDIATSLSRQFIFLGHTPYPVSLVQHCNVLYKILLERNPLYAFEGLLHYAHCAYVLDLGVLGDYLAEVDGGVENSSYHKLCAKFKTLVRRRFSLFPDPSREVLDLDAKLRLHEETTFFKPPMLSWKMLAKPFERSRDDDEARMEYYLRCVQNDPLGGDELFLQNFNEISSLWFASVDVDKKTGFATGFRRGDSPIGSLSYESSDE